MLQVLLSLATAAAAMDAAVTPSAAVIARVGSHPVLAAEVEARLRPAPPRLGTQPPLDPRQVALDEAVRVHLFAREAQRRGLAVADGPAAVVEARLVQGLIRQELERHQISAAAIPEAEALRFFQRHRRRLSRLERVRLSAIVLEGAGAGPRAERLLRDAAAASDERFRLLVERHSMDEASRARGGHWTDVDHQRRGADEAIAAVALGMRSAGEVGLAVASDGRHFVLRATEVELAPLAWDEAAAARVRNLVVQERRQHVLGRLLARLRASTRVSVDRAALARLTVP